jgi:hypothetical protein
MGEMKNIAPWNDGGQQPSKTVYKWGMYMKAVKGMNSSITEGLSTTTVLGASQNFYTPLYMSTTVGYSKTNVIGRRGTTITGNETKGVWGREIKQNKMDKYEFFNANTYKFIGGKDYKIEAKEGGSTVDGADENGNVGTYEVKPYQKNYHEVFQAYAKNQSTIASHSISSISQGTYELGSVGAFNIVSQGQGISLLAQDGYLIQGGQTATITGTNSLSLSSDNQVTASGGGAQIQLAGGKATIGPTVDLGVPGAVVALNANAIDTLQNNLIQAQAEAEQARLDAEAAEAGFAARILNFLSY